MEKRNIIVVGASAGGITALKGLMQSLPQNFAAIFFIVLHIPPYATSELPEILTKEGPLKATHPKDGEQIKDRKIYVAPPDHHLLIEDDKVLVKRGPKENRQRPSIDALFRSAAYSYGPRVIGIVLSGALNDGTSGLWTVKRLGGIAIIQDPNEASFPDMPDNVIEYVEVDYSVKVSEMGPLLNQLIEKPPIERPKLSEKEKKMLEMEITIAEQDDAFELGIMEMGELTEFTCPDCHGALTLLKGGNTVPRYRCHTGHSFTVSALLDGITENNETNLWQAMRSMEETTMLLKNIGGHFGDEGKSDVADLFFKKAEESSKQARVIHDSIFKLKSFSKDIERRKA